MSGLLIATLILSSLSFVFMGLLGYKFYTASRDLKAFPAQIVGKMKSGRGVLGKLQKEIDEARDMDISKFIEENPLVVDVFPNLMEKTIQRDAQPQMINSIVGLLAPAVIGLIMNNANAPDAVKAIAGSSGATILGGVFKALGALRERAKKDYVKPSDKNEDGTPKQKDVHSMPKVVKY